MIKRFGRSPVAVDDAVREDGMPPDPTAESVGIGAPPSESVEQDAAADAPAPAPDRATRSRRRVRLTARWMVAVQVTVVSWAVFRGYFYFHDDYVFRGQGARLGWFDPAFVLQDWQGHFMPAAFAVSQPLSKLGDFSYGWVALTLALGQALVAILLMRTLLRHFGERWRVLLPLAVYLSSVGVAQATTWWAEGLSVVPLMACLVLVSDRTLRARGARSASMTLWTTGTYAAALLFSERAVLIPLWVVLLCFTLTPGGWGRALLRTLRAQWATLLAMAAVTAAWGAAYLSVKVDVDIPEPSLADLAQQLGSVVTQQLLPSVVGGGWSWFRMAGYSYDFARASWPLVALGAAVAVVALVLLLPAGPRARRALASVGLYTLTVCVLLSLARPFFLPEGTVSTLPRYFADLAVVSAFVVALATTRLVDDPAPAMLREWRPRPRPAVVVPLLVLAQVVVLLWATSVVGLVAIKATSFDRAWTLASLRSLRAADRSSPVLDQQVPLSVINPLLHPYNQYGWFFAGVNDIPEIADVTDRLRVLDDTGTLVDAHVVGPEAVAGSVPNCGWAVSSAGTWIPMKSQIIEFAHVVQVAYIASARTDLDIAFTHGPTRRVSLEPGLHDVFLWLDGGGDAVKLTPTSSTVKLCVGPLRVGAVAPGAQPQASS